MSAQLIGVAPQIYWPIDNQKCQKHGEYMPEDEHVCWKCIEDEVRPVSKHWQSKPRFFLYEPNSLPVDPDAWLVLQRDLGRQRDAINKTKAERKTKRGER